VWFSSAPTTRRGRSWRTAARRPRPRRCSASRWGGALAPAEVTPHILRAPEAAGSYLICTDGLTDLLSVDEVAACIGADDNASVTAMFEAAMAAGGRDNISIILVRLRAA
jgi:serine/threonine protein phosphatase PrpC